MVDPCTPTILPCSAGRNASIALTAPASSELSEKTSPVPFSFSNELPFSVAKVWPVEA